MRSQKQNNKAPRPFKNQSSGQTWGGGNRNSNFIPPPKPVFRPKKLSTDNPTPQDTNPPAAFPPDQV